MFSKPKEEDVNARLLKAEQIKAKGIEYSH
jgi:hypothetical protein